MNIIEKTKHDGAVLALKARIDKLKFELTNRNWDDISKDGNMFVRLGDAISDAARILTEMRETLHALQDMEPENK